MKNVYLVIERDEGYDRISCVYSTKKKADEYAKKKKLRFLDKKQRYFLSCRTKGSLLKKTA